jgi:tRNA pseudouridine55 synthase
VTRPEPDSPAEPAGGALRSGFLLCDKPAGLTSHDVVARARREHDGIRTGHAGTLDPFATGLLVVLLGGGTRLQRYVLGLPKSYEATARLGWRSSTGDPDGELTETGVVPERLELPTGEIEQRVPLTSAVRVDGERLYKRAHRGEDEEVERPVRRVTVTRAELIGTGEGTATFAIDCSSGTYVRSLIADLHDAYCLELRRAGIGPFDVADADPERIVPLDDALAFLPALDLPPDEAKRAGHGVAVAAPGGLSAPAVRLRDGDGLIALAEPREDGTLKPVVGFRG